MARAYSMDLRERAISAAQAGDLTPEEVAERFGVGAARLYAWLRRKREAGTTEPRPRGGGRQPSLDLSHGMTLREGRPVVVRLISRTGHYAQSARDYSASRLSTCEGPV